MGVKEILKSRRLELGLSMKELADKVGVNEATISRWESGNIANMKRDKIVLLAKALNISPAVIMEWEEPSQTKAYYLNEETAEIAQELFENPNYRMLFDAARGADPESMKLAADMLMKMKKTNPDG